MRLGPVWVNPRMLSNIGMDTNVFNQPDAEGPQSDFTMTLAPVADRTSALAGHTTRERLGYEIDTRAERPRLPTAADARRRWTRI